MNTLRKALWHGLINGAATRERSSSPQPQAIGYVGAIEQGAYWFGFQLTNAIVYGARK
jgi:hypothetical protein